MKLLKKKIIKLIQRIKDFFSLFFSIQEKPLTREIKKTPIVKKNKTRKRKI